MAKEKKKMGRPFTGGKYMEETMAYQFRVSKSLFERFKKALAKKKAQGWAKQEPYYANEQFRELMEKIISETEATEEIEAYEQ